MNADAPMEHVLAISRINCLKYVGFSANGYKKNKKLKSSKVDYLSVCRAGSRLSLRGLLQAHLLASFDPWILSGHLPF